MSVSPTFRTFALEQIGRVVPSIRDRAMFGGVGIYGGELFFALIDDDTLYFKVDDSNRPAFEARGKGPFRPTGHDGESMQYYALPEEVLEDIDELRPWVEGALAVASRKKARRPRKSR